MTTLSGVLFFPVTPFDSSGRQDLAALAEHIGRGLAARPGGVFVSCGTGEFHSLNVQECAAAAATAVSVVSKSVPVFTGAGGPLPVAQQQARDAEAAGADGILLMPPYLVTPPEEGLEAYVEAVAAASDLPIILYQRNNARFTPESAARLALLETVIGFKDGTGNLDDLTRIMSAVRSALAGSEKRFQFFNGMPTAEVTAQAYRGIGVDLYSSAVFAFAPEISLAFYDALTDGDADVVRRLLDTFFIPFVNLRSKVPGYAISLIKAGCKLRGLDSGAVRPPLVDAMPKHVEALAAILDRGLAELQTADIP